MQIVFSKARMAAVPVPKVEILPIWAFYGDCIIIRIPDTVNPQNTKYYLVDGGPTESLKKVIANVKPSRKRKKAGGDPVVGKPDARGFDRKSTEAVWNYLIGFLTSNTATEDLKAFKLNGVIVTHADHDHLLGVLRMFKKFPPNKAPLEPNNSTFLFNGPLLITKAFNKENSEGGGPYGVQFVELMKSYIDFDSEELTKNPDEAGFGSPFSFNFLEGYADAYYGLTYNIPKAKLAAAAPLMLMRMKAAIPARYTLDDSKPNETSIITTIKSPPGSGLDYQAVLTGDCFGQRALDVVYDGAISKKVGFFQVPHHGSARNNMPKKAGLHPSEAKSISITQLFALRILLEFGGNKANKVNHLEEQVLPNKIRKYKEMFLDTVTLEGMLEIFGEECMKIISNDKAIVPDNPGTTNPDYVLQMIEKALVEIENNVDDPGVPAVDKFVLSDDLSKFFRLNLLLSKQLYQSTVDQARISLRHIIKVNPVPAAIDKAEALLVSTNPFLETITANNVAELYRNVDSLVYFISASGKHNHPTSPLLQGLIKGVVEQKPANKRTLLLTTGGILSERKLPDYASWKDYVTIRYLNYPHSLVDPLTGTCDKTTIYDPSKDKLADVKNISDHLLHGNGAKQLEKFQPRIVSTTYAIIGNVNDKNVWIALDKDSNLTKFDAEEVVTIKQLDQETGRVEIQCQVAGKKVTKIVTFQKQSLQSTSWVYIVNDVGLYLQVPINWGSKENGDVFNIVPTKIIVGPAAVPKPKALSVAPPVMFRAASAEPIVREILIGILGEEAVQRLTTVNILPPEEQKFLNEVLTYQGIKSEEEQVVTIHVQQPTPKPLFLGSEVESVSITSSQSSSDTPSLVMVIKLESGYLQELDLSQILVIQNSIEEYLNAIGFDTPIEQCTMGDMVVILLGDILTAISISSTTLPTALANEILFWKIDTDESRVFGVKESTDNPDVVVFSDASIQALIPTENSAIELGNFQVTLQTAVIDQVFNEPTYTIYMTANVTNASGITANNMQLSVTAGVNKTKIQFDFEEPKLGDVFSYLGLDKKLTALSVPLVKKGLNVIPLSGAGFTLEQTIRKNSEMSLISVNFTLDFDDWKKYLPSSIQLPDDLVAKCQFFLIFPEAEVTKFGTMITFASTINGDSPDAFKMSCQLSVFPNDTATDSADTGYFCKLDLYTQSVEEEIVGTRLSTLLNALGLASTLDTLATAIPPINSFFDSITLQKLQVGYNTNTLSITEFHVIGSVPYWKVFEKITIANFVLQLDYEQTLGWGCELSTDVVIGDYTVSAAFILPVSDAPGSLSVQNSNDSLTIAYFLQALGLEDFSDLPVIGNVLSITIKSVSIGFQVKDGSFSLTYFTVDFLLESADFDIFTVSEVNVSLSYSQTEKGDSKIAFSIIGYINKKAYLDISYDPENKTFEGRITMTFSESLSISECVNMLIGSNSLSENSAYNEIQTYPCADIAIAIKAGENNKLTLTSFHITLLSIIQLGRLNLEKLELGYDNPITEPTPSPCTDTSADSPTAGLLPAGASLQLSAALVDIQGPFGVGVTFDCTTKSDDATILSAEVGPPSPDKVTSLRAFLQAVELTEPPLPDSAVSSDAKPDSNKLFDLIIVEGSINLQVKPNFTLKSFSITTTTSQDGWQLMEDPSIILQSCILQAAYADESLTAALIGVLTIEDTTIHLSGKKTEDKSEFSLLVGGEYNYSDFMPVALGLSPASKSGLTIPDNSGLPDTIPGSFAKMVLTITDEKITLLLNGTLSPTDWTLDLGFKTFSLTSLSGQLDWERVRKNTKQSDNLKPKITYSLKIQGDMLFGTTPLNLAMEVGSNIDTVIQAEVDSENLPKLDLNKVMNDSLGFAPSDANPPDKNNTPPLDTPPDTPPASDSSFTELLPNDTTSISFQTSAYVYFNLTQKLFILYGQANIGSIFIVAGKLSSSKAGYGYAVSLSIRDMSSFIPPLKAIEDIITLNKLNGSVINFDGMDIGGLVANVAKGKNSLGPEAAGVKLPFDELTIKTGSSTSETLIKAGTSLYAEIDFTLLHSGVLSKLVSIQHSKSMPADIVIYAAVAKDSTQTLFIAQIESLTLLGLVTFSDIVLKYQHINNTSNLSLTGDIEIPGLIGDKKFYGDLSVTNTKAIFALTGDGQPTHIPVPLDMFGVTITEPELSMEFDFPENKPLKTHYKVSGKVNFFSHPKKSTPGPPPDSSRNKEKPSFTLECMCIFDEVTPTVVDVTLPEVENPLTISDLSYTLFKFAWSDINLPDIGLYTGMIYYATKDYKIPATTDGCTDTVYKQGYFASCKTFIFEPEFTFVISANFPSDKTGFKISGSTVSPIDFGIIIFCGLDNKKNFTDTGPALTYNCIGDDKRVYLEAGIKFLDVVSVSLQFGYDITKSQFMGTVAYPGNFLGVDKPSVSFSWSKKKGFAITDWSLGKNFDDFDNAFAGPFNKLLTNPKGGCKAIVSDVVKNLVSTKFNTKFSTADDSDKNADDLVAFKLTGSCDFEIVGKKVASIDLPKIIIHITKIQGKMTMENVADYILNTLINNAESIVEQLSQQPLKLTKIIVALSAEKAVTMAAKQAISSLVCRGADEDKVEDEIHDSVDDQTQDANDAEEEFDEAFDIFEEAAEGVVAAIDVGFVALGGAAADLAADLGVVALGIFAGLLATIAAWFGIKTAAAKAARKKKEEIERKMATAKDKIESCIAMNSPLNVSLSGTKLELSWRAFPSKLDVTYHIAVDLTIPNHTDPHGHIEHSTTSDSWSYDNNDFPMCSAVNVTVYATCVMVSNKDNSVTYKGASVSKELTQTAKIPPPSSVSITFGVGVDQGDVTVSVGGIVSFVDSVEVQLLGSDPKDRESQRTLLSKQVIKVVSNPNSSATALFKTTTYWSSKKSQLMVKARCLSTGLQSSEFVYSTAIPRLPSPASVSHTLPLFNSDPKDKITLNWTYPVDKNNLEAAYCEILSSGNSFINKTVKVNSAIASSSTEMVSTAQFEKAQFLSNIPAPPADDKPYSLGYQVSFTNGSSYPNSLYTTELKDFYLASTLKELHVKYDNDKESLAISWLPVPETELYQAEFIEKGTSPSKVVASEEFDDTERKDGKHLATYYLSASNMKKFKPGLLYTLSMYSLGNAQTVLYNDAPKNFDSDIHYLSPPLKAIATYDPTADSIAISITRVPNAVSYHAQLVQYDTAGCAPVEITKVTVTDETPLEPSTPSPANQVNLASLPKEDSNPTISATIILQRVRSQLQLNKQYGIKVFVSGEPQDIPSAATELPNRWTLASAPQSLTVGFDTCTDRQNMMVSSPYVQGFSTYKVSVENTSNNKTDIKTVMAKANTVHTSWLNSNLPSSDNESGGQFTVTIQTISNNSPTTFNSSGYTSPTEVTLLQTPSTVSIEYGANLESMVVVYNKVPNCTALDVTISNKTQNKTLAVLKPNAQASSIQVTVTINPSSLVAGDIIEGTCIAKGENDFMTSLQDTFTSPAVSKAPSPTEVNSSYEISTGINTITWKLSLIQLIEVIATYKSCSLVINTSGTRKRIDDITSGHYKHDLFADMQTTGDVTYGVATNSKSGSTPTIASSMTQSAPVTIKSIFSNITAKQVPSKPSSVYVEFEVAEGFEDDQANIVSFLEFTAEGKDPITKQPPQGTNLVTDIDLELGVQYTMTLRSQYMQQNVLAIGQPVTKIIDLGIPNVNEQLDYYTYTKVSVAFTIDPIFRPRANAFTIARNADKTGKGTFMLGFTSKPPFHYASLTEMSESAMLASSFYFLWKEDAVWHNNVSKSVSGNLSDFNKKGQEVKMAMCTNGDIHVFLDDKDCGTVWFGNVPADVEIYGVCVEVREPGADWPSWEIDSRPNVPLKPAWFLCFDHESVDPDISISSNWSDEVTGYNGSVLTADIIPYGSVFQISLPSFSPEYKKNHVEISFALNVENRGTHFGLKNNTFEICINYRNFYLPATDLDLRELRPNDVVGIAIMPDGSYHVYVNGKGFRIAKLPFPDNTPLYGRVCVRHAQKSHPVTFKILPLITAPELHVEHMPGPEVLVPSIFNNCNML